MASCTDTLRAEKICDSVAKDLGYSVLKDIQKNVISSFVLGNDVFAVLPTGYGKSLCYACLPGVFNQINQKHFPHILRASIRFSISIPLCSISTSNNSHHKGNK